MAGSLEGLFNLTASRLTNTFIEKRITSVGLLIQINPLLRRSKTANNMISWYSKPTYCICGLRHAKKLAW